MRNFTVMLPTAHGMCLLPAAARDLHGQHIQTERFLNENAIIDL
jgi:hypothetical protein